MGQLTFITKDHLGSGNFEYTYECSCVPMAVKTIKVTSGNDNQARQIAQLECDEYCDGGLMDAAPHLKIG